MRWVLRDSHVTDEETGTKLHRGKSAGSELHCLAPEATALNHWANHQRAASRQNRDLHKARRKDYTVWRLGETRKAYGKGHPYLLEHWEDKNALLFQGRQPSPVPCLHCVFSTLGHPRGSKTLREVTPANSQWWLTEPALCHGWPCSLAIGCVVWWCLVLLCRAGLLSLIKVKGRLDLTCPPENEIYCPGAGWCVCPPFILYQRNERNEANATRV